MEHFKRWRRWLQSVVGIGLHAQPDCVATTGFHNKVSTVPESPWSKLDVEPKFEIQIQICNHFFCNHFCNDFSCKLSLLENIFKKKDPSQAHKILSSHARGWKLKMKCSYVVLRKVEVAFYRFCLCWDFRLVCSTFRTFAPVPTYWGRKTTSRPISIPQTGG